jgi:hypothetical protein
MNFLIDWAVSYHIGESDWVGNEVATAVETVRSRQETRGREQAVVAWLPEIVKVLADAVQKALSTPLVIERLNAGGTEVFWSGPQDFSDFVKTELVKWTAAIKEAGIEPE